MLSSPAMAQSSNGTGLDAALGAHGITLHLSDSENLLANLSGGVHTGATLQGVATATFELDTHQSLGWPGGTLHVTALQIHGQQLSPSYLANLQTANGNESEDATRLWELWYSQSFAGGRANIKLGQQSIDNEFIISQYSGLFVNTMAGWPLLPTYNMYGGGPAYPLAALGARLQWQVSPTQTLLAGVFDDNPGGGNFAADAQRADATGAKFNLNTGALFMAEFQYQATPWGLPGSYKAGIWYDSGSFADQRYSTDGLSLASPASNGRPVMHHGDYTLYAVLDQTLWQSARDNARSFNIFARIMAAPDAQNLTNFFFNGGITLTAPLPGRENDQAGIDFGLGRISSRVAQFNRDSGAAPRTTEALIELTYQAQALPWLVLQPDVQYIINPGAGIPNPRDPAHKLSNELVAGVRAVTNF